MSNILDYIAWRGDLPFSAVPVNEVDGLILAQLSMLRWENGLGDGQSARLCELSELLDCQPVSAGFTPENDLKLVRQACQSVRFGAIVARDYTHAFDERRGMQFAAVTLCLDDGTAYVSFRGTDSSLVGWKEDCDMAFSEPVPSQVAATEYLEAAAGRVQGALRVGGHSKGGNLAMYAVANASPETRARVVAVYSNDGPGLSDRMNARAMYENIVDRLQAFVPQDSIVGMLLVHPGRYTVVRSNASGFMQHDPYSWQVKGPAFERLPALGKDGARFEAAFHKWLGRVNEADRRVLVDTLFEVLGAVNVTTFGLEFWHGLFRNPISVLSAIQGIDAEKRRRINQMIADFGRAMLAPGEHAHGDREAGLE